MQKVCATGSGFLGGGYCFCSKVFFLVAIFISFFVILFPNYIELSFGGYATQRGVLTLICGFLVLMSFLFLVVNGIGNMFIFFPTLALVFGFLLAPITSDGNAYAWVESGMYAFYFLAFVVLGVALAVSGLSEFYALAFLGIAGVFLCVYGLVSFFIYLVVKVGVVGRVSDFIPVGFANVRYWSHIATWCLPLIPVSLCISPLKDSQVWRAVVLVGLGIWWWMLFITVSRGAILGIIFGVTFVGALLGREALPWIRGSISCFLVGVCMWIALFFIFPEFSAEKFYFSEFNMDSSGRICLFFEAWKMSLDSFPFGMGPQSWLTHDAITADYENGEKFSHPHNMYLMWAAEYGWLVIGLMSILVMQAIRAFFSCRSELYAKKDSEKLLVLAGFTASVSAALFHSGVSAVFIAPASMLIGVWVLSGFWSIIKLEKVTANAKNFSLRGHKFRVFFMVGGVVVIAVLWLLWANEVKDYYNAMRSDELSYDVINKGVHPRFWLHGDFPRGQELVR